jgi:hypothetical protein
MNAPDLALVLYGSRAREDDDAYSDVDILCATESSEPIDASACAASAGFAGVEPSVYTWDELDSLHSDGSLFLVHLARDGRLITTQGNGHQRYAAAVTDLPPYVHIGRDLAGFATALDDARQELASGDGCTEFELSVVASVVRHASILGCFLLDEVDFGRYSAVSRFCSEAGLPEAVASSFPSLYAFRLAQDGRIEFPEFPPAGAIQSWLIDASLLVEEVRRVAGE